MCATRTESDLPQYFYIPPNATTRNYYVCLTPPKALHHIVGRGKYRESTHTADLRKAKPIGARLIAAKLAEWKRLLATSSPAPSVVKALTPKLVDEICARRLYQWMYEGEGLIESKQKGMQRFLGNGAPIPSTVLPNCPEYRTKKRKNA
jgi:hypothetical protein